MEKSTIPTASVEVACDTYDMFGDKVCYQPSYLKEKGKWENGMVKEIPSHTLTAERVVYNCAGEWHRFKEFTSALTDLSDLFLGWKHENDEH